jgi:hypothetical protein
VGGGGEEGVGRVSGGMG